MIIMHRMFMLVFVTVIATSLMYAQGIQSHHTIGKGIRVVMGPLDQFSRSFGLQDDKIEEAVRSGIESNGWRIDETSDLIVTVVIVALPQREEDKYSFRVELHGGSSYEIAVAHEGEPWVIGDTPAVKTIDVAWGDYSSVIKTANQFAKTIAAKLRREVTRRSFIREKIFDDPKNDDASFN